MKKWQHGFTLIELMIVVAIIGILAAIAIPAYSNYQSKAKLTSGVAEASAYRTAFELYLNEGNTAAPDIVTDLKAPSASTSNCTLTTTAATIVCEIVKASSQVNGGKVTWTRSAAGAWTCNTDKADWAPASCKG